MKRLIVDSIQKAVNGYLELDPESKQRASALNGKAVSVELLGMGLTFQMLFSDHGIELLTEDFRAPTTTIQGTPLRLLHIALSPDNRQRFFAEDAAILGSAEVGQQVMELFDCMEIDWEEYTSRLLGDTPARHIGRFSRGFKEWGKRTAESLLQNINEYSHEEIDLFPPVEAIHDFFNDVDTLRMDVDRLEARVERLTKNIEM